MGLIRLRAFFMMFLLFGSLSFFAAQEDVSSSSESRGGPTLEEKYVEKFVQQKGIDRKDISNVSALDLGNLPQNVHIENLEDNNIAVFEVNYTDKGAPGNVFVITYAVDSLRSQSDLVVPHDKRTTYFFGSDEILSGTSYLAMATGVPSSATRGYVLPRDSSVTGVSTSLEVVSGEGVVQIIIYRNGEAIGLRNVLVSSGSGTLVDYDLYSYGVTPYFAGDTLSVAVVSSDVVVTNIVTQVEVSNR